MLLRRGFKRVSSAVKEATEAFMELANANVSPAALSHRVSGDGLMDSSRQSLLWIEIDAMVEIYRPTFSEAFQGVSKALQGDVLGALEISASGDLFLAPILSSRLTRLPWSGRELADPVVVATETEGIIPRCVGQVRFCRNGKSKVSISKHNLISSV